MKLLITSTILFLAMSPLAHAKHDRNEYKSSKYNRAVIKAKVIDSTPVYKYINVRQPHTYCEPVAVYRNHHHSKDNNAAIVGGIVGGVIGHAVSDNNHKRFGTMIGAVIGSTLVHQVDRANNQHSRTYQAQQQKCVVKQNKASKVRVLDGYRVTYRSKGKIYRTFRQDKPAKYIRINS